MKPDVKSLILFAFPFVAFLACTALSFTRPAEKPYSPARPEFLAYIDQLSISSGRSEGEGASETIRNVFASIEPVKEEIKEVGKEPVKEENAPVKVSAPHPEVWVSMIAEGGKTSFCVINGTKMKVGESTGSFTLTAIRKGAVTIRYSDGIEETIHVKAF